MEIIKLIFTTTFSLLSIVGFFYFFRNKNQSLLKFIAILGILGKIIGVLVIYIFFPSINQESDAALYYLPQVKQVIAGNFPYIDFQTSYSILFHYFLVPIVYVWPSVGAIALMMVVLESVMVIFYLSIRYKKKDYLRWYVVFLYTFNPISIYWIITGYNSILISFIALVGFALLEYHKDFFAGVIMTFGFLISKFLIILMWPGFILYRKQNWLKRNFPFLLLTILLVFLLMNGIDVLEPIKYEAKRSTSGNLWFLILSVAPSIKSTTFWDILPGITFGIIFIPIFVTFAKINYNHETQSFEIVFAFISIIILLFMIISKKTYPFYLQMGLLFLIHTTIRSKLYIKPSVFLISFLGSITTIEPYLFQSLGFPLKPLFQNKLYFILLCIDILMVLSYSYLIYICYKLMTRFEKKSILS